MSRPRPLYWAVQLAGWAAVLGAFTGLAWASGNVTGEWTPAGLVVSLVGSCATFVAASHVLRAVVRRWRDAGALRLGAAVGAAALGLGVLVTGAEALLDALVHLAQGDAPEWSSLGALANTAFTSATLLGLWATAYILFTTAGRLRQSEREALGLRAALAEAELATLRAQVNPHFLFNALNTVRALISADPKAARQAVTGLSAILRSTLAAGRTDTQPLSAELDVVRAYLGLETLRFEERLGVEIDVAPEALGVSVPALSVLTLVENAVKHGIADRPEGGTVRVWARVQSGRLRVSVENPPAPPSAHADGTGSGLRLVRERLSLLHGDAAHLTTDLDVARVEMRLPALP